MKTLKHPNIVTLKHYFHQNGETEDELFLNLVLEFVPDTVYKITRYYAKSRQLPPLICVKVRPRHTVTVWCGAARYSPVCVYVCAVIRIPALPGASLSACHRHLPPRHQAAEPTRQCTHAGAAPTVLARR